MKTISMMEFLNAIIDKREQWSTLVHSLFWVMGFLIN